MHTENHVLIEGSLPRIFALGANIGDWANILPHYRSVTVHSDDGLVKQATMAATRDGFPVRWRTSQVVLPAENRLLFFHTGGVSRGMYVEWRLVQETDTAVRVTISHELAYPARFVTDWFAQHVVGQMFVANIAGKTLATIKTIAENERTTGSAR